MRKKPGVKMSNQDNSKNLRKTQKKTERGFNNYDFEIFPNFRSKNIKIEKFSYFNIIIVIPLLKTAPNKKK